VFKLSLGGERVRKTVNREMKEIISYGRFRCAELAPHKNRGMEITYVERGMLDWMVEGVSEKVHPGTIFFTLPWQIHGSLNPKEPENMLWHILFHLAEDYSRPRTRFLFPANLGFDRKEMQILSQAFSTSPRHGFRATPAMRRLMPELVGELQSTHELRAAHAQTLLRAVLVELKRIVLGEVQEAARYTPAEQRTRHFIHLLSSSCDQKWTLEKMAAQCGIRRTQLNKVFQKLTGGTPMEYLFRLRLERAKTLLRETDIKIVDIALECGYASSQYFSNSFRQATGSSPTQYRLYARHITAQERKEWECVDFRSEKEEQLRIQSFSTS
jgi:AraC family L-rhamnose operon regulatory protein RhaS